MQCPAPGDLNIAVLRRLHSKLSLINQPRFCTLASPVTVLSFMQWHRQLVDAIQLIFLTVHVCQWEGGRVQAWRSRTSLHWHAINETVVA